jgi:hypothetical protein
MNSDPSIAEFRIQIEQKDGFGFQLPYPWILLKWISQLYDLLARSSRGTFTEFKHCYQERFFSPYRTRLYAFSHPFDLNVFRDGHPVEA